MKDTDDSDQGGLQPTTRFLGGQACLDFANTTEQVRSFAPQDWMTSYAVLLAWSEARGTLAADAVKRLERRALRQPATAAAVFSGALAIRTDIRKLASALAD